MGRLIDWCRHADIKLLPQREQGQSLVPLRRLSPAASPLSPILGNPGFSPGLQDGAFLTLIISGHYQASYFLVAGFWTTLQDLANSEGLFPFGLLKGPCSSSKQPRYPPTASPLLPIWATRVFPQVFGMGRFVL